MRFTADLDATQEFGQLLLRLAVERIAGGRGRFVQRKEGEVAGIEEIARGIGIGLD